MKTQIKLVYELIKERKLGKVTPIEEGDNRNEGLQMVTAKISQGNEPFSC